MTNSQQVNGFKLPSWSLWRWLGFGEAYTPRPQDDDANWLDVNVYLHLSWPDRLRVALSGKLHVQIVTQTDAVVRWAASTASVCALPPFARKSQ